MNKVYVIYNPLYEKVVCAHSSEELECDACKMARKKLENTAYNLEGFWLAIDSNEQLCYCGNPVETSNPDCVEFQLCKEHALDS